jgi:FMN-dependent NADH-azoreductase
MMAKLLYITCDLQPVEHSRSLTVGSEFLTEYLKWNPEDEIHMLDLYRDNIQRIDTDVLSGLGKMRNGHHLAALTSDEQRKVGRIWRLADQFARADKYVFVTPMMNPGFPAELWVYIDTVLVDNKTYRYTPNGPEGLLKNQGKKCLLIHSTDEFDPGNNEVNCVSYLRSNLKFMGIEKFQTIAIKGVDGVTEKVREWICEAAECAARF